MPVIDDIRESRNSVNGKGFKYKAGYYWEYYRKPALVVILVAIFLFSIIKTVVTAKDMAFQAIMINAFNAPDSTEFAEEIQVDLKKYDVYFDYSYKISPDFENYNESNYTSMQKLMAVIAAGTADVLIGDKEIMEHYADSQIQAALTEVFTDEELKAFEGKIIYHDVVDTETGEIIAKDFPLAINVSDSPKLTECGAYYSDDVYLSVVCNSTHPEYVKAFLKYLYE